MLETVWESRWMPKFIKISCLEDSGVRVSGSCFVRRTLLLAKTYLEKFIQIKDIKKTSKVSESLQNYVIPKHESV